jgi:hypothetical protein
MRRVYQAERESFFSAKKEAKKLSFPWGAATAERMPASSKSFLRLFLQKRSACFGLLSDIRLIGRRELVDGGGDLGFGQDEGAADA